MPEKKKVFGYLGFFTLISACLTGLLIPFTMALFKHEAESDGVYGKVSLRSYFDSGTGTANDPYVITRPRHLYNLSRLQSFGVFDSWTCFQLGKKVSEGVYRCYTSKGKEVPFLDMSDSNYEIEPIKAIGSEAKPFYGEFKGNNLEIKNLTVYADPEDAGLFGYTAHGSNIHDLYISNITINALGYTSTFNDLYGSNSQTVTAGTSFAYNYNNGEITNTFVKSNPLNVETLNFDAAAIFNWDGIMVEPTINDPAPVITYNSTNRNYKYKFLISGDFLKYVGGDQKVMVDLASTYKYFKKEKANTDPTPTYPINASSSVSLVVSKTDNLGLDHSKVISTLQFDFSLANDTTTALSMTCHLGEEHTDNIGLIVGHCDGSIENCYVSSGTFVMNDGTSITGDTHLTMTNGSSYGLIGKIGGTVHNRVAEDSDSGTGLGKSIGVLDFSSVYDEIIDANSFKNNSDKDGGKTYIPKPGMTTYEEYLRKHDGKYITKANDTVSFNGRKVINNKDLGVFTVATDYYTTGMNALAGEHLDYSMIKKEAAPSSGSYYVYYATGEYNSAYKNRTGYSFANYRDSFKTVTTPTVMHLGYHFPRADQVTSESFEQRDLNQNYFFRFKIDPSGRADQAHRFYFADVNKDSPGGSFVSKYFEHKLVNEDGEPILASENNMKSGVMLRTSLGYEISKLNCSFATPDMSGASAKMICLNNTQFDNPVANMVNFEVKSEVANVTVVAGLVDKNTPAAVGVYCVDRDKVSRAYTTGNPSYEYVTTNYESPDYAFFMPTDKNLAYFDYAYDTETQKWDIGTYDNYDNFQPATIHTSAVVSQGRNVHEKDPRTEDETRLYAHVFKLKKGKYCIGSATSGLAKIYYVCAQGQTDGQLDFEENAYSNIDEVKNVDFIKREIYSYNKQDDTYLYNGEMQRCYISLLKSDRSTFAAALCKVKFEYDSTNGYFAITSPGESDTSSQVTRLVVSSYADSKTDGVVSNTLVKIFNGEVSDENDTIIIYPPPSS